MVYGWKGGLLDTMRDSLAMSSRVPDDGALRRLLRDVQRRRFMPRYDMYSTRFIYDIISSN